MNFFSLNENITYISLGNIKKIRLTTTKVIFIIEYFLKIHCYLNDNRCKYKIKMPGRY